MNCARAFIEKKDNSARKSPPFFRVIPERKLVRISLFSRASKQSSITSSENLRELIYLVITKTYISNLEIEVEISKQS